MGYYNKFKIKFIDVYDIDASIHEDIFNHICDTRALGYMASEIEDPHMKGKWYTKMLPEVIEIDEPVKWYDYKEDLLNLSQEFPELHIQCERWGESPEDYEMTAFKNGKKEDFKIIEDNHEVLEKLKKILGKIDYKITSKGQLLEIITKHYN